MKEWLLNIFESLLRRIFPSDNLVIATIRLRRPVEDFIQLCCDLRVKENDHPKVGMYDFVVRFYLDEELRIFPFRPTILDVDEEEENGGDYEEIVEERQGTIQAIVFAPGDPQVGANQS